MNVKKKNKTNPNQQLLETAPESLENIKKVPAGITRL